MGDQQGKQQGDKPNSDPRSGQNPKGYRIDPTRLDPNKQGPSRQWGTTFIGMAFLFVLLLIVMQLISGNNPQEISSSFLKQQIAAGTIREVTFHQSFLEGVFKEPYPKLPPQLDSKGEPVKSEKTRTLSRDFWARYVGEDDRDTLRKLMDEHAVEYRNAPEAVDSQVLVMVIGMVFSVGLMIMFWLWLRRQQSQMMGGISGSFGRSPAKRYEGVKQAVTFADVAGIDTVKAELTEVVEFLKNPDKFIKLGGRIPKGVLLNGPPGTGKTLLARAVAGEAGVPFFSVNGSEFIQMFVGVGASRVRDLFARAKEVSPSIIFIDEIDAVGRQRGAGLGGGNDEREQTLNQILSEMDGFNQGDLVIVIGATNRLDVLDPALLRPGRFDRHVTVGRPSQKGRLQIFKVHVRDVPLAADVDLELLAQSTTGLTGADIRNLVNEACLWAARHDKTSVSMADFDAARDKILMGVKREEVLLPREKEKTAYHEAGHTLLGWILPGADRVTKVTIVPRGHALGVTQFVPAEERMSISETQLRDRLAVLLGGRAAERIVYDESEAGAENDLERATGIARRMVMNWGMSDKIGPVSYKLSSDDPFLGRELHQQRQFSERTMELIDEEVARILREAADRATELLSTHREKLDTITFALIKEEELDEADITRLIGPAVDKTLMASEAVSIAQEAMDNKKTS